MKKLTTKERVKFLQSHIRKWHRKWHKNHPENIIGFRIGKKRTNEIEGKNYSIIFLVKKKIDSKNLNPKKRIPSYIRIKFPDGITRQIETDVEETGVLKLHMGITDEVDSNYSNRFGTAGLFVTDSTNKVYLITNYHVVAEEMINAGQYFYQRSVSQTQEDVKVISLVSGNASGRFEIGIISHEVDAAFVEVSLTANSSLNTLPDNTRVKGRVSIRPYPPTFKGNSVIVYSYYNRMGIKGTISDNSSILYTDNPKIFFEDLLEISPKITQGGDSGGVVLTPSYSVIGLVVGGLDDNEGGKTYVIPFYKIDDFKNIFII